MSLLFVLLLFTADCMLFVLWSLCVMDHSSEGSVPQIACSLLCTVCNVAAQNCILTGQVRKDVPFILNGFIK